MNKSILVCCSNVDESTLSAAVYFAKMFRTSVTLLHAFEPLCDLLPDFSAAASPAVAQSLLARINEAAPNERLNESAAAKMLGVCEKFCQERGVVAQSLALSGELDECVASIERDYRLIIAQQPREEHSHIYDILRACSIPLMLAPQSFLQPKRVIFCYDASEALDAALKKSLSAPLFAGCERICLHMSKDKERANAVLAGAKELFAGFDISVQTAAREPMSAKALCEYALSEQADTIAIGAYSKSAIKHFFAGSYTDEIIQTASDMGLKLFIFR